MAVDPNALRQFSSHFTTGMAVVTSCDANGGKHGLTLNAVAAASQDPPLYLACLSNRSNTLAAVRQSRSFCVHFLERGQEEIAGVFASKAEDKFGSVEHDIGEYGSPVIAGVLAAAECRVSDFCAAGSQTIVIGTVERVHVTGGSPLIYHRGGYATLTDEAQST